MMIPFTREPGDVNGLFYDGIVAATYLSVLGWVTLFTQMRMLGIPLFLPEPKIP